MSLLDKIAGAKGASPKGSPTRQAGSIRPVPEGSIKARLRKPIPIPHKLTSIFKSASKVPVSPGRSPSPPFNPPSPRTVIRQLPGHIINAGRGTGVHYFDNGGPYQPTQGPFHIKSNFHWPIQGIEGRTPWASDWHVKILRGWHGPLDTWRVDPKWREGDTWRTGTIIRAVHVQEHEDQRHFLSTEEQRAAPGWREGECSIQKFPSGLGWMKVKLHYMVIIRALYRHFVCLPVFTYGTRGVRRFAETHPGLLEEHISIIDQRKVGRLGLEETDRRHLCAQTRHGYLTTMDMRDPHVMHDLASVKFTYPLTKDYDTPFEYVGRLTDGSTKKLWNLYQSLWQGDEAPVISTDDYNPPPYPPGDGDQEDANDQDGAGDQEGAGDHDGAGDQIFPDNAPWPPSDGRLGNQTWETPGVQPAPPTLATGAIPQISTTGEPTQPNTGNTTPRPPQPPAPITYAGVLRSAVAGGAGAPRPPAGGAAPLPDEEAPLLTGPWRQAPDHQPGYVRFHRGMRGFYLHGRDDGARGARGRGDNFAGRVRDQNLR